MKLNPWKRQGLFYVATLQARLVNGATLNVTRVLNFVEYHAIRLYYGEQELIDMAYRNMP